MKIISPVDNPAEAASLIDAGADELYGGFISAEWSKRFSLLTSINQRTFASAQLNSYEDLCSVVTLSHDHGRKFSLTLNAPFYTDQQLPAILEYVEQVVAAGVDGIILADISLLRSLRRNFSQLELHASTLAYLANSEAARCYIDAGINRLILPRHLPVSEMAEIVANCPEVDFDAFLLVGKCPNSEGLCTFHHSSADRIWPCEIPYNIEPVSGEASPVLSRAIEQQHSWSISNRRHGCGLCAIPHLLKGGIKGVKLVGRGTPSAQKINNIILVRGFIALAAAESDFDLYRNRALAAHLERFGTACSPNVCYYPEFYQESDSFLG